MSCTRKELLLVMLVSMLVSGSCGNHEERQVVEEIIPSLSSHMNLKELASIVAENTGLGEAELASQPGYDIVTIDGVPTASNRNARIVTRFEADSITLLPVGCQSGCPINLRLESIGRGEKSHSAMPADLQVEKNLAAYRRGEVTEWYRNEPSGLRQGFFISMKPLGGSRGELRLGIRCVSGFSLNTVGDDVLSLEDPTGKSVILASGLIVRDADGVVLNSSFEQEGELVTISIDDEGAAYPVVVDPVWAEQVKLLGGDCHEYDRFGLSVDIEGETAAVSTYQSETPSPNAAYIFYRNEGGDENWGQVRKLSASDTESWDSFGRSLSLSGDTLVVGAPRGDWEPYVGGGAYVFERNEGSTDNWGEVAKVVASDAEHSDYFGRSVSVDGDTFVVGANGQDAPAENAGAAYVFERNLGGDGVWGERKKLIASDAEEGDSFGVSVAISGDVAIVGAENEDEGASDAGAVYLFSRDLGGVDNWGELKKIVPGDLESELDFGEAVAIDGDVAVVGSSHDCEVEIFGGAVYVYERDQGGVDNWGLVKKIVSSDLDNSDYFGSSVHVDGDSVIVGAWGEGTTGSLHDIGAAYIFSRDLGGLGNWGQVGKIVASDGEFGDDFGFSVSISDETSLVGSYWDDDLGNYSGSAYIFEYTVAPDGYECVGNLDCASGYCVDDVCCESACGGGDTTDCQACSLAAGAMEDGFCEDLDGVGCDDGVFCNGQETCVDGICSDSTGDPCDGPDGDWDCAESCNETADDCTQNDEFGSPCDDGDDVTTGDHCDFGSCVGTEPEDTDDEHDMGSSDEARSSGCGCLTVSSGRIRMTSMLELLLWR